METPLGGERVGNGDKVNIAMRDFERSTHDLSKKHTTTAAAGTIIPMYFALGLPGDKFNLDLEADALTMPTVGPLFGAFKLQVDAYWMPLRLFSGKFAINLTGAGLEMQKVPFPQIVMDAQSPYAADDINSSQISTSSIFWMTGIKGLGVSTNAEDRNIVREFSAFKILMYYETCKQYYWNKQEGIGAIIHNDLSWNTYTSIGSNQLFCKDGEEPAMVELELSETVTIENNIGFYDNSTWTIGFTGLEAFEPESLYISKGANTFVKASEIFGTIEVNLGTNVVMCKNYIWNNPHVNPFNQTMITGNFWIQEGITADALATSVPKVKTFDLKDIDEMRLRILRDNASDVPYQINKDAAVEPYTSILYEQDGTDIVYSKQAAQEGLALATYMSDMNQLWVDSEWLDGDNGINALTAVQITNDEFQIDELNLRYKLYKVMMRVAVKDGTIEAWQEANWTHAMKQGISTVMFLCSMEKKIVFQEVVSTAASSDGTQPLGQLAGRGKVIHERRGGKTELSCDEAGYVMVVATIRPYVKYYQGNDWDNNLRNFDQLHVPGLDGIGFQDLVTDRLAWFDTRLTPGDPEPQFRSAGKQPAWMNYMSMVDEVSGAFARKNDQGFMNLLRDYEPEYTLNPDGAPFIKVGDMTTYIDPVKSNHIFANGRRDAMNFWLEVEVKNTARRKLSAKQMPNL